MVLLETTTVWRWVKQASDNDGVAVGEASHADRDEVTTNDKGGNATSDTNIRRE